MSSTEEQKPSIVKRFLCAIGLHDSYYFKEGMTTSLIKCRTCKKVRVVGNHG